jgi:hypothetical protein
MFLTSLEYHALVTVPLLVMGVVIRQLIPLGAASLVISILLCFVAGWQALLPPSKRRRWSRPLIALLFFSQPIVRGWARYQGQLSLNPAPLVGKESLDQLSLKHKGNVFGELRYRSWSWFDRMTVLGRILERFDQFGWPNKVDEGWKGFDVEIYGSRWCTLQMTTAVERSEGYVLRIRLKPSWSFMATVCFWSLLGFELVVLGFVWRSLPELWLLLFTVLLFAWWLNVQKQELQRLTATFLDGVADELKLERLPFESPKK